MSRKMKDSGIPWIGEIPEGWKVYKVKHKYTFTTGFTPNSKNETYYDDEDGVEWITISDMGDRIVRHSNKGISKLYINKFTPTITPKYSLLYSFKLSVGQVSITDRELYTNEAIAAFSGLKDEELRFLFYSSQVCIEKNANENIYGAKLLNQDLIKNATIIYPPLFEQKSIANFLDRKCSEIDEMISLQKKIIEELKAYKQSVITEAVTKGLNLNVPMKDSGVEWIGMIPEGWSVKRLKNVFLLKTGTTPNGFEKQDDGDRINWFTPSDISECGNCLKSSERTLSRSVVKDEGIQLFPKGSLLFVGIGATAGKLGYSLVEGYSNQQITALIPTNGVSKFFFYFLVADRERLRDNAFYTTLPIINNSYLSKNKMLYPPIQEQQQIADYLDKKCSEIDTLISLKQSKIENLKEYKKSLIYEYVTGKGEIES